MAHEYDDDPTRGVGEEVPDRERIDEDPTRGAGERGVAFDEVDEDELDEDAPVEDPLRTGAEQ
jgi:hypothetical protein